MWYSVYCCLSFVVCLLVFIVCLLLIFVRLLLLVCSRLSSVVCSLLMWLRWIGSIDRLADGGWRMAGWRMAGWLSLGVCIDEQTGLWTRVYFVEHEYVLLNRDFGLGIGLVSEIRSTARDMRSSRVLC